MTCDTATLTNLEWRREQSDWMQGDVSVNVVINAQPVAITFDGVTYIDAEWMGAPGTTRSWQAYVTPADIPAGVLTTEVVVRIKDTSGPQPVEALLPAGTITFT